MEVVPKMVRWRGLRCGTIQEEASHTLPSVSIGAARRIIPFLSCIGKRTREGCNRGSEVGTVQSGQDWKGSVPLRKLKESGRRNCEKDFIRF